ncbi:adhesion G-protein coupled receptor G7 isoform X4 [Lepisosteus oculatus]|uniref:adhesion G-protein coupled receptor G7 isoform X4 n=1 Tax=Lepisosteus oculatus TaxID=7918 RepID=UPI0035F51B5B
MEAVFVMVDHMGKRASSVNSSTTVPSPTTASPLTSPTTTVTPPPALSTSVSTLSTSPARSSTASPATLPATTLPWCENSGRYQAGICICPDEWYGDKCEKAFFCNSSVVDSAGETLTFDAIVVGWFGYSKEQCGKGTPNAGISKASRRCTNTTLGPTLDRPIFVSCRRTLGSLAEQIQNNQTDLLEIASNTQILTSQPEKLTAQEISNAAEIMRVILNASTTAFTEDIAVFAVTTISQLLNASDAELSSDSVMNNLNSLTKSLEDFSLDQHNISQVVQPNVAVQSLSVTMGSTQGVQFTALTGDTNNLVSNRIELKTNATQLSVNNKTSIDVRIFVNVSAEAKMNGQIGFVLYQNDKFFRSKVYRSTLNISRRVISGSVKGGKINHVDLLFSSRTVPNATLHDHSCVFWDYDQEVWSTAGCTKGTDEFGNLRCQCNHTTNFAVLMTFKHDYKYSAPLQWITFIGCGLSIAGLFLTIVIQIITRKSRKATPTLLLVSICLSMLIFNIVFISGINNPNANKTSRSSNTSENILLDSDMHIDRDEGPCTAVTALLHYFLLATFTWALLYAIQMYILLVDIFRHPPKHFGLIMTAIGWGFPAVVVAVTLGALYRIENPLNYRQEEFCWLAALDSQGRFDIRKPMLWAFLLPVALILLSNMVILVCVILTLCKNNPALKSTKKNSYLKKLLSSLSIAVVLGISWVLGYLMLIDHQQSQMVFSYVFCILNTTQGLQIFFLFVVRTPLFRKKVSDIFYSIPTPEIHLHSKTFVLKYKHRGYVGRYRKTDTSFTSVF